MRRALIALAAGTLFGAGLAISGMADPARVRAFLDIFGGAWDPTLGLVMAGAIAPMAIAWRILRRMERPIADSAFHLPDPAPVTRPLMAGAAIFGVGWGVAGLCPGPAIADLALRPILAGLFVMAMLVGFVVYHLLERAQQFHRIRHMPRTGER